MELNRKIRCPSIRHEKKEIWWLPIAIAGASKLGSGVANAASTKSTNATNLQIAREQNQFNYEQWMRERDYNEYMWNKQNEYNTPRAQYQRYVDAGINPHFALGNIQSGQAQTVTAPQGKPAAGATMQAPDYSFIGNAAGDAVAVAQQVASLKGQQIGNNIAGIDLEYHRQKVIHGLANLAESTRKMREETVGKRLSNKYQEMVNDFYDRTQQVMENRMKLENQNLELQMKATNFDMAYKYADMNLKYAQFKQEKTESDARINSIKNQIAIGWANYGLQKQMTNAQISYYGQLTANLGEQFKVIKATGDGIVLDNKGKAIQLKFQTLHNIADLLNKRQQWWNMEADIAHKKAAAEQLILQSDLLESKNDRVAAGMIAGVIVGGAVTFGTGNPVAGVAAGTALFNGTNY